MLSHTAATKAEEFEVTHIIHIKIFGTGDFSFLFLLCIASFTLQTTRDSKLLLARSPCPLAKFQLRQVFTARLISPGNEEVSRMEMMACSLTAGASDDNVRFE